MVNKLIGGKKVEVKGDVEEEKKNNYNGGGQSGDSDQGRVGSGGQEFGRGGRQEVMRGNTFHNCVFNF